MEQIEAIDYDNLLIDNVDTPINIAFSNTPKLLYNTVVHHHCQINISQNFQRK